MALLQRFSLVTLFFMLVACGGGEGGGFGTSEPEPDPGTTSDVITLSLSISDTNVSDANPATISATVLKGTEPQIGVLVRFTLDESVQEYVSFTPLSGTSLTGNDGIATMILNAGGTAGAGEVNASVTIDDASFEDTITFSSAGDANTGTTPNVENITLFASSQQIASSGAQDITLTAIAKDGKNNLLENVEVSFAASSGQIEIVKSTTGPDGQATATLKTTNEPTNRVISITTETTGVSDSVDVEVVGTSIQLTGSSSLAINDPNDFIIRVLDSDGNGIANTLVTLSTDTGATLTLPATVTTDFTGQARVTITGSTGGSNVVSASALGATSSQTVNVQADSFLFSAFDDGNGTTINLTTQSLDNIPDVLLSDTAILTLTWLRSGTPVPDGTVINFSATRGDLAAASATTVNGEVSVALTSTNAGKSLVTFSGVDGAIALDNQLEFEFIAETANRIVAQADPHSISPNGQTSTISVVVTDPTGNLVKNKQIDFTLTDISGGSIFPASAITDSNGNASTVYTSNTVSAQDGVSIRAVVRDTPIVTDTVTLTVADREVFIALGTGNSIEEIDTTNYNKQFSVFVTDIDSTPVADVELTVSAVPKYYYKGIWARIYDGAGTFVEWQPVGSVTSPEGVFPTATTDTQRCNNEDKNIDGILDVGEDDIADGNGNGNGSLTPGNVVAALGNLTTDEEGKAIIDIRYPQSFGNWVDIELIVSARVNGTESSTRTIFTLPNSSEDILDEDITPPTSSIDENGPFGAAAVCIDPD